ncbi:hypothetical protein VNO78_05612 [Psophocarpus tetragonolobus]|uniref:Uncharacterized protein n=1 Tax=Psophocarpus tetragonolobus TaxID=3891 RepID=A0AAN9SSM4_PSOTE
MKEKSVPKKVFHGEIGRRKLPIYGATTVANTFAEVVTGSRGKKGGEFAEANSLVKVSSQSKDDLDVKEAREGGARLGSVESGAGQEKDNAKMVLFAQKDTAMSSQLGAEQSSSTGAGSKPWFEAVSPKLKCKSRAKRRESNMFINGMQHLHVNNSSMGLSLVVECDEEGHSGKGMNVDCGVRGEVTLGKN